MIALVLLVLGLTVIAALPEWPYSRQWGYGPTGTLSLLMVILMLLVIAGLTDLFDGFLARKLHQQTRIGQYLDPIADKLLLSTLFMVLAILHLIKWRYTVVVFSRDIGILKGEIPYEKVVATRFAALWQS